jgi:hypothetical protein
MNRILVFGPVGYDKVGFVEKLFQPDFSNESEDSKINTSTTVSQIGTVIDDLQLSTKYYNALVTAFVDEPEVNTVEKYKEWIQELSDLEMQELREQLQFVVIIYPENQVDSIYEIQIAELINNLNDILDKEHCELHPESLQWDGELLALSADDPVLIEECRQLLRCVVWRDLVMEKQLMSNETNQTNLPKKLQGTDEDLSFIGMETDLAALRRARDMHSVQSALGKTELSIEEEELVESLLDKLCK